MKIKIMLSVVVGIIYATFCVYSIFKFRSDMFLSRGIFFSKAQRWDEAVEDYRTAEKLNPLNPMPAYFSGNVYVQISDVRHPVDAWRRLAVANKAYEKVLLLAPYYVQVHYHISNRLTKEAFLLSLHGRSMLSREKMSLALSSVRKYQTFDPVFLGAHEMRNYICSRQPFSGCVDYSFPYPEAVKKIKIARGRAGHGDENFIDRNIYGRVPTDVDVSIYDEYISSLPDI